jgi:uncharacterized membrane protein (DUF4010 family)
VLVRLGVLAAVLSPGLLPALLPILGSGLIAGLICTALFWRSNAAVPELALSNPTELRTALSFGLLYGVVLFAAAWLSDYAGSSGLYTVALVSGLTDVDPITLSSLHLFELGKLTQSEVVTAISIAYIANMTFKFGMIVFIGSAQLIRRTALGMAAIVLTMAVSWMLLHA